MTASAKAITRGHGHKAVAAAAYRSGEKLHDEKHDVTHDYRARGGVEHSETALPKGAPGWMSDRARLWNAVEAKEDTHNRRAQAQLAKEFMCPMPRELDREQQIAFGREWVNTAFTKRGLVADWALHQADASDGEDNPHIHVMVVTRDLDKHDLTGFGKKWAGDPSVELRGRKHSPLDSDAMLLRWKEEYTAIGNKHLAKAGSDVRITHLSYADQGIDKEGGLHKGKAATALEKKRRVSRTQLEQHNRDVALGNQLRPYAGAIAHADAAPGAFDASSPGTSWEDRRLQRGAAHATRDALHSSRKPGRVDRAVAAARQQARASWQQRAAERDKEHER